MLLYILYLKVYIVYILMARPPPSSAYLVQREFFHAADSSVPSVNRSMLGLFHSPKMIVT